MRKDVKIFLLLALAASVYFGFKYVVRKTPNQQAEDFLAEVREKAGTGVFVFSWNTLHARLDSLIATGNYQQATAILDSAQISKETELDYRGLILHKQGKAKESIALFSSAINDGGIHSISVANRAKAYIDLKLYDSAVKDYKTITGFNHYYYRPLAETFELMKEKDSALKYYNLFMLHYPDSVSLLPRIKSLLSP